MRDMGLKNLGGVFNFEWANPADDSDGSVKAAALQDGIYNRFFLDGIFKGRYPANVLEGLEQHLPSGWQDDFGTIGAPLDWVGLNYYTRSNIAADDSAWPSLKAVEGPLPKTQMGWEIYPDGLYDFLIRTAKEYTGDLPLYVTENGMANADVIQNGAIDDAKRIDYLNQHFDAARRAMAEGVPLAGYFVWSLLDNYEWALGYEKRFGLIHVDFDTLQRTPKSSYHALKLALT